MIFLVIRKRSTSVCANTLSARKAIIMHLVFAKKKPGTFSIFIRKGALQKAKHNFFHFPFYIVSAKLSKIYPSFIIRYLL